MLYSSSKTLQVEPEDPTFSINLLLYYWPLVQPINTNIFGYIGKSVCHIAKGRWLKSFGILMQLYVMW